MKPTRRCPRPKRYSVAVRADPWSSIRNRDPKPILVRTDPGERDVLLGQEGNDLRIVRMRRCQDDAIGLERRNRTQNFALDMVAVGIDEFEYHSGSRARRT